MVPLRGECVLSLWCHNNNFVFFIHLNNLEGHATTIFSCYGNSLLFESYPPFIVY